MTSLLEGLAKHPPIFLVLLKHLTDHEALQLRQLCTTLDKAVQKMDIWWTSRCMELTCEETLKEARANIYGYYLRGLHSALVKNTNTESIVKGLNACIALMTIETRNNVQLYEEIDENGFLF